jgi:predicted nucleotidyltransferase
MSMSTLRAALERAEGVQLAVLFGSTATGRERLGSDIDVAVALAPGSPSEQELAALLSRATGRVVDVIRLETAPPLLRFEIARDGRLILARSPHAWVDFRARAMVDWWDWAPTARYLQRAAVARLRGEVVHGPA